ncbi:hypothetical protein BpHYR1_014434 [Brachionus plicatilis]|uniref:Uncharacterized protein n=1 Tax=Brachionus plicatilis TaxID=10195 RepID=A0A3M7P7I7_BRAPC|nr:hypothetical protein BpHYR1_014434 [Brachionus plicatilis]
MFLQLINFGSKIIIFNKNCAESNGEIERPMKMIAKCRNHSIKRYFFNILKDSYHSETTSSLAPQLMRSVLRVENSRRLASDGLDCPAGNTRTCYRAIERQLIRNCEARTNFFTNRIAGDWNVLDAAIRCVTNTNTF